MTDGSTASIRFRAGIGGEPVLAEVQASAEYTFVPAKWGATVIGSAAHPVSGDHLGLRVEVGVGCCAEIRGSAVTVARRGSRRPVWSPSSGSTLSVTATVGRDAMLTWRPEPGVAADSCHHRVSSTVALSPNSRLLWADEFVIERRSEALPGTWGSRLRVVRDGWPVVCRELALGPASPLWESPAVLEGARAVSLAVVVDPEHPTTAWTSARTMEGSATAVALPLAGPGTQVVAWGDDLGECRGALESVVGEAGMPDWALRRILTPPVLDPVG